MSKELKELIMPFCFLAITEIPHMVKHKFDEPDNSEQRETPIYQGTGVLAYGRMIINQQPVQTKAFFPTLVTELALL